MKGLGIDLGVRSGAAIVERFRAASMDPHQRGDASLGFVFHDYSVKHEAQLGGSEQ
jgi:hypothetical protein